MSVFAGVVVLVQGESLSSVKGMKDAVDCVVGFFLSLFILVLMSCKSSRTESDPSSIGLL